MEPNRFDQITRLFATRHTRRSTLAASLTLGAGVGALALNNAAAEDATPVASPAASPVPATTTGEPPSFLFVQSAATGSFTASTTSSAGTGTHTLTLNGHTGGTIYFSDRPERIFGNAPTGRFLEGIGFGEADPPNAALVVSSENDQQSVVVLELLNPAYDRDSGTLTYDANILTDYQGDGLSWQANQRDTEIPESFAASSLFIDDCPDAHAACSVPDNCYGNITYGQCWSWSDFDCLACKSAYELSAQCNETFSNCNGECVAQMNEHCNA
ncbi:MAG: hypothetical protein QM753_05490 [Thermomicrobiales bacterium]